MVKTVSASKIQEYGVREVGTDILYGQVFPDRAGADEERDCLDTEHSDRSFEVVGRSVTIAAWEPLP